MKNILLKKRLLKGMIPLLCLLLFPTFVFAQKLTVSGQVKDALGEPVIGANVVVKGTTNGAMIGRSVWSPVHRLPVLSTRYRHGRELSGPIRPRLLWRWRPLPHSLAS